MILLIVSIGLLNICLGFGLAMYYGYGPPGLDGILEALGPMPPAVPSTELRVSGETSTPHDLPASPAAQESTEPGANLTAHDTIAPASESLAEEEVLGDVCDLAATAETAMLKGQVESRE